MDCFQELSFAAERMGIDLSDWPRFERLEVLPHGVSARKRLYYTDSFHENFGGVEWNPEVRDWWREEDYAQNILDITNNFYPAEQGGAFSFDATYITKGALVTCNRLWEVRDSLPKTLAVFVQAWAMTDYRWGDNRQGYSWERPAREALARLLIWAGEQLGEPEPLDHPRRWKDHWFWRMTRMLPGFSPLDPVTYEPRLLRNGMTVTRAIIHDAALSQTEARLVHLVPDPAFDPEEYQRKAAVRKEALKQAEEEKAARWRMECEAKEAQRKEIEKCWAEDRARREVARAAYLQRPGIDLGSGFLCLDDAAKQLGIAKPTLRTWLASYGLSVEQIRGLAANSAHKRGTPLDDRLARLGLIPGLPAGER